MTRDRRSPYLFFLPGFAGPLPSFFYRLRRPSPHAGDNPTFLPGGKKFSYRRTAGPFRGLPNFVNPGVFGVSPISSKHSRAHGRSLYLPEIKF